ncbi:MAG: hypothetical protein KIT13_09075 [Burkholderiales bacterium]|nr:hypothetical protein [Burkholderiales bacterium]
MNSFSCSAGGALLLSCAAAAAAQVSPELWDRPRSAAAVMAQDAVRQAVAAHHARAGSRMIIVHGTRPEAQLQAEELRAWLVALAVDGARLSLRADPVAAELRIEVSE